jgi:hypothetical protein
MLLAIRYLQRALTGLDYRSLEFLAGSLAGFWTQRNIARAPRGCKCTRIALFRYGKGNGRGSAR